MDGTDFRIQEPSPFSKEWYSHKFKGPGLRYEIGVSVATGRIVSFHGPFPCGSFPDIKIFRLGMKTKLLPGEQALADSGYRGDSKVCTDADATSVYHRKKMSNARARHETINGRLKTWGCLKQTFRHHRSKHHIVFKAVLTLVQTSMNQGSLSPFQVVGYFDPLLKVDIQDSVDDQNN